MPEPTHHDPVRCGTFRRHAAHFLADEVPEPRRSALQAHLDGCAGCAAVLDAERRLDALLRRRLRPEPAPPGLESRIRTALAAEREVRWALGGSRVRRLVALAAAVLLMALLIPAGPSHEITLSPDGTLGVQGQEVLVVDRECDHAGRSLAQQRGCRHPYHVNALRLADGGYWNLSLDGEAARRVVLDPEMRGRRLRVDGSLFARIRTLQLARFEFLRPG